MTNIENLKKEVDSIKISLNELKNNISLSNIKIKDQAEAIKIQVDMTKLKIQQEILSLKNKLDEESKKKKIEAETLLKSLSNITDLYDSIINSLDTNTKAQSMDNKNIFTKAIDRIWKQRDSVRDKKKRWRSSEWWKNVFRTVWFIASWIWGLALTYKWIKNLWKRALSNDEEKTEKTDTKSKKKKEKKSFWNKWYWKALKWIWIGTAAWWWIYLLNKKIWWKKEKAQQQTEIIQEWWDTISDAMFKQLLHIEGSQDFVAKTHKKKFWESFVTWPYGMVYKHIDANGNLLKAIIPFKDGEHVNKDWAEKNARAYYNKKAKEWSDLLKNKWYKYSQDMLDALVCASGWTKKSQDRLKNYVLSHWGNEDAIYNFMSNFAITAAWNWKVMPGLIRRRKFEANWFKWNKQPLETYRA